MAKTIDAATLRAWWAHRQGLDGSLSGSSAASVLARAGWARSVGGCSPYLTLFSRSGISREQADSSVAALDIHELPSARGCTYVLPAADFALGLTLSQGFFGEMKTAEKLGIKEKEIHKLCESVLAALEKGPLDPDALREATGKAVRNLGPEGQKKGLTTTLPVALGKLQRTGDIRRIPVNGRLDQQRYKYTLWRPSPLTDFKLSNEEACVELARRFFKWIGPATIAEFQGFSALGVKASNAVVEPLKLEPIAPGDDRLSLPEDRAALADFKPAKGPHYTLVGSIDSVSLLHVDLKPLLDPKDLARPIVAEKETKPAGGLKYLPNHAIIDRGRLVGLWDYDQSTGSIAWISFVKKDKTLLDAIARTEAYVRDQLGDARSFSLDSPKSRAARIEALRNTPK
ncbi:MAG TPA: crosslink repair DNA glycosylase YcaQ family protein [Blastocatellia bacterium]